VTVYIIVYIRETVKNYLKKFYNMIIYYHGRCKTSSRTISLCVSHERHHIRRASDTRSLTFPVRDLFRAARRFRLPRSLAVIVSESFLWWILGGVQKKPQDHYCMKTNSRSSARTTFFIPSPRRAFAPVIGQTRGHQTDSVSDVYTRNHVVRILLFL